METWSWYDLKRKQLYIYIHVSSFLNLGNLRHLQLSWEFLHGKWDRNHKDSFQWGNVRKMMGFLPENHWELPIKISTYGNQSGFHMFLPLIKWSSLTSRVIHRFKEKYILFNLYCFEIRMKHVHLVFKVRNHISQKKDWQFSELKWISKSFKGVTVAWSYWNPFLW